MVSRSLPLVWGSGRYGRDTRTDLYQHRRREVWENNSHTATMPNHRGRFIDAVSRGHDDDHRSYHRDRRGRHRQEATHRCCRDGHGAGTSHETSS
ncbi:hypothetical protein AB0C13_34275 [Streptomyces sp. NPDC049099]|uniref:hypothetical protein n=1 Tax=Streptomyces sp. NPDC049099 TaxID=3155768 RepID=UPI00341D7CA6